MVDQIEVIEEALPEQPRLRPVEVQWIEHAGQPRLMLRDRLGLAVGAAYVPAVAAPLLALCDGTRDLRALHAAFLLRTGVPLTRAQIERLLRQLNDAGFLEGPRFERLRAAALAAYRAAPHRAMALAPHAYPASPVALAAALDAYGRPGAGAPGADPATLIGIVSPHIDYVRGGAIYARTWWRAAEAVRAAELVVILGTDHCGSAGRLTLTRQHYATPYGPLPTDAAAVERLAEALDADWAFAEELHHRQEHSIELAAVWLHHVRGGRPCALLPILCGSFHPYTEGERDPAGEARFAAAVETLRELAAERRTVFVAAGDLAHVGPAFGDPAPHGPIERHQLHAADAELIEAIRAGDPGGFFARLRAERDRRKVCGLPPIYLMLRALEPCAGEVVGYDQCPADAEGTSWVTIGGVLLHRAA